MISRRLMIDGFEGFNAIQPGQPLPGTSGIVPQPAQGLPTQQPQVPVVPGQAPAPFVPQTTQQMTDAVWNKSPNALQPVMTQVSPQHQYGQQMAMPQYGKLWG